MLNTYALFLKRHVHVIIETSVTIMDKNITINIKNETSVAVIDKKNSTINIII